MIVRGKSKIGDDNSEEIKIGIRIADLFIHRTRLFEIFFPDSVLGH